MASSPPLDQHVQGRRDSLAWSLAGANGPDVRTSRRVVHDADGLLLEDSTRDVLSPLGRGHSAECQIVFPYFGAFDWRVGKEHRLIDANSTLFVAAGTDFREDHPNRRIGHGSAIFTVGDELLDDLGVISPGPMFDRMTRPMADGARLLVSRLLFSALPDLERAELVVALLASVAQPRTTQLEPPNRPVIQKAKQVLHEHGCQPLSLTAIADRVGVSPVYLTQAFAKSEGMPLYRYHTRLRLSRALFELLRYENLIELALDLGFSSHSHFTYAFRTAFGMTPSAYRAECSRSASGGRNRAA